MRPCNTIIKNSITMRVKPYPAEASSTKYLIFREILLTHHKYLALKFIVLVDCYTISSKDPDFYLFSRANIEHACSNQII